MASPFQTDPSLSKYKISRRGRKLQVYDDHRTLLALPKDVPERTWAEILQREESDLIVLDIREEIVDLALSICYERYMEKQTVAFTAHCAAEAWLKLIDWNFYRHDPGEDPSAYPPCHIPNRTESWIPDEPPEPSPKDTWARQELDVVEEAPEETIQKWPSIESLDLPVIDEIPPEYWFPGKINWPEEYAATDEKLLKKISYTSGDSGQHTSEEPIGAESEVLQKVTDYSTEGISAKESSTYSALKTTTPVEASLRGAGDSKLRPKKRPTKSKLFSKASVVGRSRGSLPPLDIADSRSHLSVISDCRLRNLRLDTQYEISSQKLDTPPGEVVKRK